MTTASKRDPTISEAARIIGVTELCLGAWIHTGDIKVFRTWDQTRFPKAVRRHVRLEDLKAFITNPKRRPRIWLPEEALERLARFEQGLPLDPPETRAASA